MSGHLPSWRFRVQLGLLHLAVAMTLVPINGTLNRVMIKELGYSAAWVAFLASLPYLLSPMQMWIGAYADRRPLWGYHRSPYVLLGLALCVFGVMTTPLAAYWMLEGGMLVTLAGMLAFGAWGMGYNFATVSYFALLGEGTTPRTRGRTVAVMMTMMILGIIATSLALSRMLEPYTPQELVQAFQRVGWSALVLGLLGLWGLERRENRVQAQGIPDGIEARPRTEQIFRLVVGNPQARRFFLYMVVLLTALLAQDVLLEPFAAEAFQMPVHETTRITALWGACFLVLLALGGWLEQRVPKKQLAQVGNLMALVGFLLLVVAGLTARTGMFYFALVLVGSGTGLSTVSNMSLMFDLTTPGRVGLYIGAWGTANAFARWFGSVAAGVVRDVVTQLTQYVLGGYLTVFALEALLLAVAMVMLPTIRVEAFRQQAQEHLPSPWERAAMQE